MFAYIFLLARWGIIIIYFATGALDDISVGAFYPGRKFIFKVEDGMLLLESNIIGLANRPIPFNPDSLKLLFIFIKSFAFL